MIIEPAEEEDKTKVGGDICAVLFPDHIKKYKQQGIWPFGDGIAAKDVSSDENGEEESGSDDDLFVNNNRPIIEESESDSDSEEESEDEK